MLKAKILGAEKNYFLKLRGENLQEFDKTSSEIKTVKDTENLKLVDEQFQRKYYDETISYEEFKISSTDALSSTLIQFEDFYIETPPTLDIQKDIINLNEALVPKRVECYAESTKEHFMKLPGDEIPNKPKVFHAMSKSRESFECDFCSLHFCFKIRLKQHLLRHVETLRKIRSLNVNFVYCEKSSQNENRDRSQFMFCSVKTFEIGDNLKT